jgi:hypothetical protein
VKYFLRVDRTAGGATHAQVPRRTIERPPVQDGPGNAHLTPEERMDAEQGNRLHSLQTVDAFLTRHAERLPTVAGSGARRKLDEILAELSRYVSDQSGSALAMQAPRESCARSAAR